MDKKNAGFFYLEIVASLCMLLICSIMFFSQAAMAKQVAERIGEKREVFQTCRNLGEEVLWNPDSEKNKVLYRNGIYYEIVTTQDNGLRVIRVIATNQGGVICELQLAGYYHPLSP